MITTDKTARSSRYRILESAISFTENYQNTNLKGKPIYDVVYVGIVSNASIMVYDVNNGIDFGADLQYKRWRLSGATTGLASPEAHNIYAKLSKSDSNLVGDIVFSTYNYTTQGVSEETDAEGNPLKDYSDTHWMIKIGTLSALSNPSSDAPDRTLTFDPGQLGTQKDNNEKGGGWVAEMFDLIVIDPKLIKAKLWFEDIKVKGESFFEKVVNFYDGIRLGNGENAKVITSVAADIAANEDDDKAIATPSYVKVFSEARYLRYDISEEQSVAGTITFEQDVTVQGDQTVGGSQVVQGTATFQEDVTIGNHIEQGDIIQGAKITKDGMASFAGIKSPSMQIYELNYNRKTAVQGEYVFSDGETIEKVEYITTEGTAIDSSVYNGEEYDYILLTVRTPYAGYITTFKPEDILYSNVNMIGESGTGAKTGKCWMYVLSESEEAINGNTIKARLYAPSACPSGNIAPQPHMTISRHGNITDKSRQDLFIISSENSNMVMLRGVNSPIIANEGMYGVVVGKLPESLFKYVKDTASYVSDTDPYVYARGVIVQDLIMLDYQGKPIAQERYRGDWNQAVAKGLVEGEDKYQFSASLIDTVTYNGSLWRCGATDTEVTPKDGIAEWHKKVSKGDDSTAVVYQLKPSANVVYYRTAENKLSVDNLEVVVGVTDNDGYYEIADQYTLEQQGLAVYYAVDGEGEPTLLNISSDGQFVLEDGSGLIIAETGNELLLEGDSLDISAIKDNITLYLKDIETNDDRATYIIPVIKDGEEGKQGRMLYPAGEWNATKKYAIENNSAPFVRYQANKNSKPTYYVLVWEGDAISGIDPATDVANNGGHWKAFSYMNYLFAEFLMANWARFGGENGGVFYEKWLFSQDGVTSEGEEIHYSDYDGDIFDEKGELGKGFTPNLAIDFKTGAVMMNNLTEMFHNYGQVGYVEMGKYNNIIVQPCSGVHGYETSTQGLSGPLVILPQEDSKSFQNGSSISIFAEVGDTYRRFTEKLGNIPVAGVYAVYSTFALISADNILGEQYADGGNYLGSWIVCHGRRSKYLILAAGDMVRLRMTKSGDMVCWVVENSSDIDTIEGDIYVNKDLHWVHDREQNDFTQIVDYEGTSDEGFVQIAFTNKYEQSTNWNSSGDSGNPYTRMLFASKTFISTNGEVYLGYNNPHIILSTNSDGWWDSGSSHYHYRLLDRDKDENFPLTKE